MGVEGKGSGPVLKRLDGPEGRVPALNVPRLQLIYAVADSFLEVGTLSSDVGIFEEGQPLFKQFRSVKAKQIKM